MSGSLCLNCLCRQYGLCWKSAFLLGTGYILGRERSHEQSPVPILGTESLSNELVDSAAHTVCCWGTMCILCNSPEEDSWKLAPGVLWASPHGRFPSASFPFRYNKSELWIVPWRKKDMAMWNHLLKTTFDGTAFYSIQYVLDEKSYTFIF